MVQELICGVERVIDFEVLDISGERAVYSRKARRKRQYVTSGIRLEVNSLRNRVPPNVCGVIATHENNILNVARRIFPVQSVVVRQIIVRPEAGKA